MSEEESQHGDGSATPAGDRHVPPPRYGQAVQPGYGQAGNGGYAQPVTAAYAAPGTRATVTCQPAPGQPKVRREGVCEKCDGQVTEEYTTCAYVVGIGLFPCGLLCCIMMKENKCKSCGAFQE